MPQINEFSWYLMSFYFLFVFSLLMLSYGFMMVFKLSSSNIFDKIFFKIFL